MKVENETLDALVDRDGLTCFLCGARHQTIRGMRPDCIRPLSRGGEITLDNLVLACRSCVQARNQRPLGAYLQVRLAAMATEHARITTLSKDKELIKSLQAMVTSKPAPIPLASTLKNSDGTPYIPRANAIEWKNEAGEVVDCYAPNNEPYLIGPYGRMDLRQARGLDTSARHAREYSEEMDAKARAEGTGPYAPKNATPWEGPVDERGEPDPQTHEEMVAYAKWLQACEAA